jgi:hypothetical protein
VAYLTMRLDAPNRSLEKWGTSVVLTTIGNMLFPFGIIAMSTNVNISAQRPNPPPTYIGAGGRLGLLGTITPKVTLSIIYINQ